MIRLTAGHIFPTVPLSLTILTLPLSPWNLRRLYAVLLSTRCHNKVPYTGWLINKRNFQQFWRLEVCDEGASMDESGENVLPGCRLLTSPCFLTWMRAEKENKFSYDSFKGANTSYEGSPLMTSSNSQYFLEAPPNIITLGIMVSTYEFCRTTSIWSTTLVFSF